MPMTQTPFETRICIYCIKPKNFLPRKTKGLVSEFTKEHVLHDSLLTSGFKNAPTLVGRVCQECNSTFGKTIDLQLGRTGYEGFQRFKVGIKSIDKLHELGSGGLEFGAAPPGETEFVSSAVTHTDDGGKVKTQIEPFILVHSLRQGKKISVRLGEIGNIHALIQDDLLDFDTTPITFATNGDPAEETLLTDALKVEGINIIRSLSQATPSPLLINSYSPSDELLRATAKIAFNYFAYLCESTDPSIATSSGFGEIRNYIQTGVTPASGSMFLSPSGLIKGSTRDHSAAVKYIDDPTRPAVTAHVSLFNCFTYSFVLSKQSPSSNFPEAQGHRWDLTKSRFGRVPTKLYFVASNW